MTPPRSIKPTERKAHWETVYRSKAPDQVSWYQERAEPSFSLIRAHLPATASVLDAGGGASRLTEQLWAAGYRKLAVVDISPAALEHARSRLGSGADGIYWIEGDILATTMPAATVDCWHDRAVFHFLTDPAEQERYVEHVRQVVRPGGYLLIATFADDGPTRCSGLPAARYAPDDLERLFGAEFRLIAARRDQHQTPAGGEQAFTYCLFRYEPASYGTLPLARLDFAPELTSERLRLRPWRADDAPVLKAAIDQNLDHLRPWMPWAQHEPSPLEVIRGRIERFAQDFSAGLDGVYGIFARDDDRVLGGTGLHLRIAGGVEIGYWLDYREQGRGVATEASRLLIDEAFRHPEVHRIRIRCDPRNLRSAAVPNRLGFRHVETLLNQAHTADGATRDTMVWELGRAG